MKRLFIGIVCLVLVVNLYSDEQKKTYDLRKAYVFRDATMLISETDLYCTFFIAKKVAEDVILTGAEDTLLGKSSFSDGDTMFINRGARDGIKEGDVWVVLEQGERIDNPMGVGSLGTYHLKKSLAEVTCVYDDKACVTLMKGCNPVNIGDMLVPFKPEDTVFKRKIDYRYCRLPASPFEGFVVYNDLHSHIKRAIAGTHDYVAVDLGKALLSKGDFVLFYKRIKKTLPPVIIGSGIVINPQNTNSTVKILDASFPIEVGDRVVLMPETDEVVFEDEDVPLVETLGREEESLPGEQRSEIQVFFDLGSSELRPGIEEKIEEVKQFISDKSEFLIILRGYADSIGGLEYNLELSQDRVEAVKQKLMDSLEIEERFIETYYYGEEGAPYDNTLEEERRKNRLVLIEVLGR